MTEKVLSEFNIDKKNVLAVVSDNASNMVRMVKDMNVHLDTSEDISDDDSDDLEFKDEDPNELVNVSLDVQTQSDSDEGAGAGAAAGVGGQVRPVIYHMRCAAHSLALSVKDGTDERHPSRVIALVREMVKVLQRPKLHEILQRNGKRSAIVDVKTRWGSTYLMLQRVVELKDFIEVGEFEKPKTLSPSVFDKMVT